MQLLGDQSLHSISSRSVSDHEAALTIVNSICEIAAGRPVSICVSCKLQAVKTEHAEVSSNGTVASLKSDAIPSTLDFEELSDIIRLVVSQF